MYKVVYLETAQKDLFDVYRYISQKLQNPAAAETLVTKILNQADALSDNPYIYSIYHPIRKLVHEIRRFNTGNYTTFYWISETDKTVTIARVIYSRRNIGKELNGD